MRHHDASTQNTNLSYVVEMLSCQILQGNTRSNHACGRNHCALEVAFEVWAACRTTVPSICIVTVAIKAWKASPSLCLRLRLRGAPGLELTLLDEGIAKGPELETFREVRKPELAKKMKNRTPEPP